MKNSKPDGKESTFIDQRNKSKKTWKRKEEEHIYERSIIPHTAIHEMCDATSDKGYIALSNQEGCETIEENIGIGNWK